MPDRAIFHADCNNFYASRECLEHPELKTVPMAVATMQKKIISTIGDPAPAAPQPAVTGAEETMRRMSLPDDSIISNCCFQGEKGLDSCIISNYDSITQSVIQPQNSLTAFAWREGICPNGLTFNEA